MSERLATSSLTSATDQLSRVAANMDLASPIWPIERRIARSLEIIIEFLRRLGNDLAGLELVRGRDRNRRRVRLQSAPPMIRSSRKTRPPENVGRASDAKGP